MKNLLVFLALFLPFALSGSEKVVIAEWLTTGPLNITLPAFHDTPNVEGTTFSDRQLLTHDQIDLSGYFPEAGKKLMWMHGHETIWGALVSDAEGSVVIAAEESVEKPQIAYMATYIRTDRWLEASLELKSPYMLEAQLNGKKIGTKSSVEEGEESPGRVNHDVKLPTGTHLLLIKMLRPAGSEMDWKLQARLKVEEPFTASDIRAGTSPGRIKHILDFMDGVKITGLQPSPDGSMYLIRYRQSLPPSDRSENWAEIRRFGNNELVHSFRHANVARMGWLPLTNAVSYTFTRDGKTTVYCHHMETGQKHVLADGIENFAGMRWSPDGSYFVYSVREESSSADATIRQILGMQDRQAHFRHRSFLYKLDLASGVSTRITFGNVSTSIHDISPDGSKMVFSQTRPDYLERPYLKHDLFMMDMHDFSVDTLLANKRWAVSVQFSPDGNYLLATGGPSAFDRIGENIPEGMISNNYDTQAYIFSLQDHSVKPITLDFDPNIASAHWHATDNHIYMLAGVKDYQRLYRYNVRRERFDEIATDSEYISGISFASNVRIATFIGNRANAHPRSYVINLRNDRFDLLKDTDAERYRHVVYGDVNEWDFTASTGVNISGRYYLPPDFDPEKKYPLIVYQYGGTNPVSRSFGSRYPLNIWAGHGYVVYVVQPSGATGFGQEFSAAHVNNWGITVVDEIIEGTQLFIEAHPFVDSERVGVAGASYGGFMTMLLLSHTDIFATGISHAGISNLASYWGDGYWGYSYSAEATARSFPWNSHEIYVGQSPLFRADHINTPLLLVTGDSDTNVPPGESIQMYTALKLLGREVELVLVEGENHHILTYNKRLQWHDVIMAWWDKHLKDQPEWWNNQFPERNY